MPSLSSLANAGAVLNLFPAIVIMGPPHAGKSVLVHSLTLALRSRDVPHFALRAAPDGEGDWSNEASQEVVQHIRMQGNWSSNWVDYICQRLAVRHLPLLVDMGGRPTPDQEQIFDQCTHAILLTRNHSEQRHWQDLARRHSLQIIADLTSGLSSQAVAKEEGWSKTGEANLGMPMTGLLRDLQRGQPATGQAFDLLVSRVADVLHFDSGALFRAACVMGPWHNRPALNTPVLPVDLNALARQLHPRRATPHFDQRDLPRLLAQMATNTPLALYGRAPNWLIAALASKRHIAYQFDAQLGWVMPPELQICAEASTDWLNNSQIQFQTVHSSARTTELRAQGRHYHLNIDEASAIQLPFIRSTQRVCIWGRIPLWLVAGIAQAYRARAQVTAYQPQKQGA